MSKDVVDSSILFRRKARPLQRNAVSGAAVVTLDAKRNFTQVVGFQSFQFCPPSKAGIVEDVKSDAFRREISQELPLSCCVCGARLVPQRLKDDYEIVNDGVG